MRLMYFVAHDVIGGAETQLGYLVKALKKDHSIAIAYISPHVATWVTSLGVTSYMVQSANVLARKIEDFSPDIFQFYHSSLAYSAITKVRKRPKVVEVIHNRHHFSFDATTYSKSATDLCICVSPDAEKDFLSRCPKSPTIVIPNGIDSERFNPSIRSNLKKNGIVVGGFSGRLEGGNGKGVESLIRIMSNIGMISGMPMMFEFVGQDLAGWKQKIERNANLFYFEHTNKPEDFYSRWDFFVSMSPSEGFGLSIAEAISCGIPSIVYECGGITHYLEHEKHALIAKSESDVVNFLTTGQITAFKPEPIDLSDKTMSKRFVDVYRSLAMAKVVSLVSRIRPKIKTLGVCPVSWFGVRQSMADHVDTYCDIAYLSDYLKKNDVETVYFGGFMPEWVTYLKMCKDSGIKVTVSIHHTPMLGEFNKINSDSLATVVREYRSGAISQVDSPSELVSNILVSFGIPCNYIPNRVEVVPKDVTLLPGINIGIFGSGMPWKNQETQIIAAAIYARKVPGVRIHTQAPVSSFCKELGIEVVQHPPMIRESFLRLVGSMTVNLAIGMTETYGYLALESFMMGVPCLYSPMTPSVRGLDIDHVCVPRIDDCIEIAARIEVAVKRREILIDQFIGEKNKYANITT